MPRRTFGSPRKDTKKVNRQVNVDPLRVQHSSQAIPYDSHYRFSSENLLSIAVLYRNTNIRSGVYRPHRYSLAGTAFLKRGIIICLHGFLPRNVTTSPYL